MKESKLFMKTKGLMNATGANRHGTHLPSARAAGDFPLPGDFALPGDFPLPGPFVWSKINTVPCSGGPFSSSPK